MAPGGIKGKFCENEKVLCYHGPLLYEAKCVKIKKDGQNILYFVHYQGWNKNWDEWVAQDRILKLNSDNLEKKEKLLKNHMAALKDKKKGKRSKSGTDSANTSRASTPVSDQSSYKTNSILLGDKRQMADDERSVSSHDEDVSLKRSRGRPSDLTLPDFGEDSGAEDMTPSLPRRNLTGVKFKIQIPEELNYVLGSDWDLVTNKKSLFNLPAKLSVRSILNEYTRHVERTDKSRACLVSEVMAGIRDYFDAALGKMLLYKIEGPQYVAITKQEEGKSMADIYGSPHILRLMVKLSELLNYKPFDVENDVHLIEQIIEKFLLYLELHRGRLFTSKNYQEVSEDYKKMID